MLSVRNQAALTLLARIDAPLIVQEVEYAILFDRATQGCPELIAQD